MNILGFCPRCGCEVDKVVDQELEKKRRCPSCGAIYYGLPEKLGRARACRNCQCLYDRHTWKLVPTEEWERLPIKQPCDKCKHELHMMELVVKRGGIYWRCEKCGNSGVLSEHSKISKQVRELAKTPAPASIGLDLEPEQCPVCSGTVQLKGEA